MDSKKEALNDQQTSRRRHVYGFGAVIALALMLIALTVNSMWTSRAHRTAQNWQYHTLKVLLVAEQLRAAANEALRGERGYLLTRDSTYLLPYRHGTGATQSLLRDLRDLTSDNATQRAHLAALDGRLSRFVGAVDHTVELARSGQLDAAVDVVKRGIDRREIEAVLAIIDRMENEERRLLDQREALNARTARATEAADYAMSALALLFLGIVAWAGITASRARMRTLDMEEALRRAATTDELTGLPNRRAFLHMLDVELARSARSGAPLALALIDLDHFKSINDRFGHAGGDETLKRFAQVARETIRAADVIGRIGGEEFAVLMPDTDQVQSGIAGERLREAIERRRLILPSGALVPLTISVGVAHRADGEDRDRLIVRADEALYEAKESGRNRTRLAA